MPSKKIKTPLVTDRYFHIYNRGNNKEKIFEKEEDYKKFMQLYSVKVQPYADTYAFCLIPNHYHFLVKFKDLESDNQNLKPSHILRTFFQAYAIYYNQRKKRRGSLFTKYFRRIEITSDEYLKQVVYYIHKNPLKHGIMNDFRDYPYSSYKAYSNFEISWLSKSETLSWFGNNLASFLEFHRSFEEKPDMRDFIVDDI